VTAAGDDAAASLPAPAAAQAPDRLLGRRLRRLHASHSYGFILVLVVATFVFTAAAPDTHWAASVLVMLQVFTLVAALWTAGLARRARVFTALLVVAGVAAALRQLAAPSRLSTGAFGIVDVVLLAATCALIGLGVRSERSVNGQSIIGAVCVYFAIGLMFMFTYGAIAAFDAGPFFANGGDGTSAVRLYFSFVTLTTVGYGDYTAATDLGRTIAVTEALLGQVYLVAVLGVLVSRMRPRSARTDVLPPR
jgi:hypothetical protein